MGQLHQVRMLAPNGSSLCRHCEKRQIDRARALCSTCYCNSDIRNLYPPAMRSLAKRDTSYQSVPTEALPGTADKMLVMQDRASHGVDIFHPKDARDCSDTNPYIGRDV